MQVPVFHDDQHGTAIITGAALINALELAGKRAADVKVVFVGAGAAAVGCAEQYLKLGVPREHIFMCDKFGLVYHGRPEDMDEWKGVFAQGKQPRTLAEVIKGADVVVGLSTKGVISKEMVTTLAPNPILFALANPVPEILPEEAQSVRSDIIALTPQDGTVKGTVMYDDFPVDAGTITFLMGDIKRTAQIKQGAYEIAGLKPGSDTAFNIRSV